MKLPQYKFITILNIFVISLIFFLGLAKISYAAILSLDPATTSQPVGQTFTVKVTIDTEGDSVTSTDAVLNYNSSVLQVVSVAKGDSGQNPFFPDLYHNVAPSQIYIGAAVIEPTDKKTGQGVVATITFQGASQGSSDLIFDCTAGKTSDTNISKDDKNATDIVDCTRLVKGKYSIGTGIAPTQPVGQPPALSSTPTPTMIRTGSTSSTVGILGIGGALILVGLASIYIFRI